MTKEELKAAFSNSFPGTTFDETGEWLVLIINPAEWKSYNYRLRNGEGLAFDFLYCLTCIDWKTHLTIVAHLRSTGFHHNIVLKANLDRQQPVIDTVSDIWKTAEFHEREVYDLFGVQFSGHPDLRRLFMSDDWKGWPLRKDYDDPINMIRL